MNVILPPPTICISASPETIALGYSCELAWVVEYATSVSIDNGIGDVTEYGYLEISPTETTIYTITATGPGGTTTDSTTVTVIVDEFLPPMVDITAMPDAISPGEPTQLFWHSTNADSVIIDQGIGIVAFNSGDSGKNIIVYPQSTTTYTITATGPEGMASDSVTVTVKALPPSVEIIAASETINPGGNTWLYWHSANADTITIDQGIGMIPGNGCYGGQDGGFPGIISGGCGEGKQVSPSATTVYTITATGPGGTATDSVTVKVETILPPCVEIIAVPETVNPGGNTWLYWHSSNADTINIDQGIGTVSANGCYGGQDEGFWEGAGGVCGMGELVSPQTTTTYTITTTGPGGTVTDSVTVNVEAPPPPSVEIIADPETITPGNHTFLYWHSSNAEIVSISQGIGGVDLNGCWNDSEGLVFPLADEGPCGEGKLVAPQITTTYIITAIGPGGVARDSVTVVVDYSIVETPPPTLEVIADPEAVSPGDSSYLYWHSFNADTVTIDQGIDEVDLNGCWGYGGEVLGFPLEGESECGDGIRVYPNVTTTYTVTATGPGGTVTSSVTIVVGSGPPPGLEIITAPEAIFSGDSSYLYWHSFNTDTVTIDQGIGEVDLNGCWGYGGELLGFPLDGEGECGDGVRVYPETTTTYTFTATGSGGMVTDSVTVYVDEEPPPRLEIIADPDVISLPEFSYLYWHSFNADTVTIDQGIGEVDLNGCWGYNGEVLGFPLEGECGDGKRVYPEATTTYTFTATGPGGTVTDSITITVNGGDAPFAEFYAEPTYVSQGESTTLHWQTQNADAVTIDQGIGDVPLNSDADGLTVTPDETTTYTLTATCSGGQGSVSITVTVIEPLPPLVDLASWPETLEAGQSHAVIAWTASNADNVIIETSAGPDIGEVGAQGDLRVEPATTTTYTIIATNAGGSTTDSVTINVLPDINITYDKQTIPAGDPRTLTVNTTNGQTVSIDQGVGQVQMTPVGEYDYTGTVTINPIEDTVYKVTATGSGGTSTAFVSVSVKPKVTFSVDNEIIEPGSQVRLHWTTFQADTVTITPGPGDSSLNSAPEGLAVSPVTTTTYMLIATGPSNTTNETVRVHVNDFSSLPVVSSFIASPGIINPGETTTLQWETANMQEARIDNGLGDVPMYGSCQVSPQYTTTYTLVVRGPQGVVSRQATVRVYGTYKPGSFAAMYEQSIPETSTVDIEEERFSLITGRCEDQYGNPVAGVSVSVLQNPEFGYVLTDAQGNYALPVKGNNHYTVIFSEMGLLPAHRKADVLNNRIAVLDTVALIWPDFLTTHMDFDVNPEPALFHAGSYITDDRGQRRLVLTVPNGAINEPMDMVTTEYAVADCLPASLPPNTAYGFVAEIGNGNESTVAFNEPVIAWVDNFLGFTVGQAVPVGWYDRLSAKWIPCEDGVVVRLLDADNDGTIDGLDSDGDNQPDDLDNDGEVIDEVTGLAPGQLRAGMTYYRFPVNRTGPWACGWPYAPMETPVPALDPPSCDLEFCPSEECELVQQDIGIPGTDFTIHYSEARTSAYQPLITIPVTGESVPVQLEAVQVRMTVAGRVYSEMLDPEPNRTVQFLWDGLDYLGQEVVGPVSAEIAIGYVYNRSYAYSGAFTHAFNQAGFGDTSIDCRDKYTAWHQDRILLDRRTESEDFIADGWTLSAQHQVNTSGTATLHLGDGATLPLDDRWHLHTILRSNGDAYQIMHPDENFIYVPYPGYFGDLSGIAVDDDRDEVYWSNPGFDVIWRYPAETSIDFALNSNIDLLGPRFAGDYDEDSILPFKIQMPHGIAIGDSGDIFYAERGNHAIRVGNRDYDIWNSLNYQTIVGNGQQGYSGDGQIASDATLKYPGQMAYDRWGSLYIVDSGNYVIRRISADGIIETIAGNGFPGSDGDNGPALSAAINPTDIAVDARGNIFIAEPLFHKVRKIDISGIITTVAGTGIIGREGEEGPAASAQLYTPSNVTVDSLGNLYIADDERLLYVDKNAVLHRIRGFGKIGVMTTDIQDRIFLNDWEMRDVHRLSRPDFADMRDGEYYRFIDSDGQYQYFSADGKHLYTGDISSPVYTFIYDLNNLLAAVHDSDGNPIVTINRDADGKVESFESPDGLTVLSVDEHNHLVQVLTPDNGEAAMAYNAQGLLTDFTTTFACDIQGVVTDDSGGLPLGGVTVDLATAQGTTSLQTDGTGGYLFTDLDPGEYTLLFHTDGFFSQAVGGELVFGNSRHTHNIVMSSWPELLLSIDSPQNNAILADPAVHVTGQVSEGAMVKVNGVDATVTGTTFSADIILNSEGAQTITAVAMDIYGRQAIDEKSVSYYHLPSVTLTTNKNTLQPGEQAVLSWTSQNSDHCLLEPFMQEVDCNGTMEVSPDETTVYTINATGLGMIAKDSVTIVVGNTYGNPSIAEQVHLEVINGARANPLAEAARLGIDLNEGPPSETIEPDPVQPLVFNRFLHEAATLHTYDMVVNTYQAHEGLDGRQPLDRIQDAGYLGNIYSGENLASIGFQNPVSDEYKLSQELHDILFKDHEYIGSYEYPGRGHRINLLKDVYKEVGIGFLPESNNIEYPYGGVVTSNFGAYIDGANFLLGVVYDDADDNGAYTGGEGLGQVKIQVNDNSEWVTFTADAGGYGLPLEPGTYMVTATLPDGRYASKSVTIEDRNQKVDFTLEDFEDEYSPEVILSAETETIRLGQTTRLIWTSRFAHTVSLDQGIGVVPGNGSFEISPTEDIDYTITATSDLGSITRTVHITVLPPLPTVTLSATPQSIWHGESIQLNWNVENGDTCYFDQGIGAVDLSGSLTVTPNETTAYTLTSENAEGLSSDTVTVTVNRAEIILAADFQAINLGESATLQWSTENAEECYIDQGIGAVDLSGKLSLSPAVTTTYTITCSGHGTTDTAIFIVFVNDAGQPPTASISAEPEIIQLGQTAVLSWWSGNGQSFHIDNGIGEVAYTDSLIVTPAHTTTYTFTVIGSAGVAQSKVTIQVNANPAPQPDGSFGKAYEDLVPDDATVASYDAHRFALVKGTVLDIHEQPLEGVSVTMLDHPEYGTVVTDDQGEFVLVVEGGAPMTAVYRKDGLLPCQRQVYVPWNDIALIDPIQMIAEDTRSTTIHFDGNPETIITHRASVVSDQFGSRAMTMVFTGDNLAYMIDDNGGLIREMPTITTRASEYATPRSMPAKLPETSGYTYCAELTVDGAERVRFAEPVTTYVENFLGFEVGVTVPLGYYNRDRGVWVAEPNGLVVRLLDTDSDGMVDAVDGDGDGLADDLDNDGDFHDEAQGLNDSNIYIPGTTFWRAAITHFSPYDWNWCTWARLFNMFNYGDGKEDAQPAPDEGCMKTGSAVRAETRILHESINIPGTDFSLIYSSDRTEGYQTRLMVPVSGPEIASGVKRIEVEVHVAGNILKQTMDPEPDQVAEFVWDGRDFLGRKVDYKVTAYIKIGYVYDSVYMESGYLDWAFAEFGTAPTLVAARDEAIAWKQSAMTINLADKDYGLAQGWSISPHHKVTPTDPSTLRKGNGSIVQNISAAMTTTAGTGDEGWPQSGVNTLQTPISHPSCAVMDKNGELYVSTTGYPAILKIKRDQTVEVIAGGGSGVLTDEDGVEAVHAWLDSPVDLALDARGNLYIADAGTCKIRKIDAKGIITTIAGNGTCESTGDGGLAINAGVTPSSLAVDDYGNVYFIESSKCVGGYVDPVTGECIGGSIDDGSFRVRKISTNGYISTVVGTGEQYDPAIHDSIGDGGPAKDALLVNPTSLAIDAEGNIYLADGSRIRKVNTSGIITTVVGSGVGGYSGDGGLAVDAQITLVSGITFDRSGDFYLSQYYGNGDAVRKVSSNGYISTVAGEGVYGMSGDNGPATHARLYHPQRIAVDPAGFLYIPDKGNNLIRKVSLDGYHEGDIRFAEKNGLGHLISASGLHQTTYDLETGASLLEFGYDDEDRLISITDQFGNVTAIERTGSGVPYAIISPDGLRTELAIDNNNQLTRITCPDNSAYVFEYDNYDGLLTAKIKPNGNRFEHYFDSNGRVTYTNNQEGGLWEFDRIDNADGTVTSTVTTPNTGQTINRRVSFGGGETKTITTLAGDTSTTVISPDGLDSDSQTACGMHSRTFKDLDPFYGYTYTRSSLTATMSGLEMAASTTREYTDADNDGEPEQITTLLTTNNKTATLVHDIAAAAHTITSPENRTVTTTYDPDTLVSTSMRIAGLYETDYTYYSTGKLASVNTGARQTSFAYDAKGYLSSVTDPENRTTVFTNDVFGR
ncbi:MAG: carboxypeptidase regulatory-like domain-containing protein, partial [Desulfosalsimonadaceae bacterium]